MVPQATLFLAFLLSLIISVPVFSGSREASASEELFPVFPGLEPAVEFWKLVFTRYGASELIFHDPLEPTKIYEVLEVGENNAPRGLIEAERQRILLDNELGTDEKRVRIQRGVKERFLSGLRLSRRYLGQIQHIFMEHGVPADLAYLPLVESAFNIRARSRVGAVGMWQFMPATGKKFLRISSTLDERKDPLESSRAAARFLKQNFQVLGNWPLAITAYNHGREGMLRAVSEVGSRDLMEIIQQYRGPAFGFASRNFYAEFLAALDLAKRGEEFFPDLQYHSPFPLKELELKRAISIQSLLKPTPVSRNEFLEWNPALSPKIRQIPSGYRVKLPPEKSEIFLAAFRHAFGTAAVERSAEPISQNSAASTRHRVARGETLSKIAKTYRISVHEIRRANNLDSTHLIAGQHLKIPPR
ncbi:MAG: transglycosylase SLT domain-containing protein [Deltaproteobacteria bacterium]|nr:transglycosylase SLT domain-containing protein [Deltaproteobacteria bacterium]